MHPTVEELLALRDGDGDAETAQHVDLCEQCQADLEDLRAASSALNSLPPIPPPEELWTAVRRRIVGLDRKTTDVRFGVAAAIVLAMLTAGVIARLGIVERHSEDSATDETRWAIEQLSSASRELELVLQDASLRSPVLSTRQAAMIVEIEDRIALVDLALTQNGHDGGEREVALWSDRVELLDALVAARGGEVQAEGVAAAMNRNRGGQQ